MALSTSMGTQVHIYMHTHVRWPLTEPLLPPGSLCNSLPPIHHLGKDRSPCGLCPSTLLLLGGRQYSPYDSGTRGSERVSGKTAAPVSMSLWSSHMTKLGPVIPCYLLRVSNGRIDYMTYVKSLRISEKHALEIQSYNFSQLCF